MTQIRKLNNKEGEQVYPQTHTKAVIDDNGYTAESRLQAMQDEINAKPGIVQITRAEYKAKKDAGLLDQNLYYFIIDEEAEPIGFAISNESATGAVEKEIAPNVYYVWGELTNLTITFGTPATNKIINEYQFEFVSGSTPTVLTLPNSVQWSNGIELETSENTRYQISIINNIGVWNSVPNM